MPTTSAPAAGTRAARSASARRVHRCFSATRGGRPDQDDAQPGVTSLFMAPGRRHDSWFATPAQTGTALLRSPQQEAPRRPRRTIASATLRSSGSGAARAASRFRNGPRASGPSPHHTPAASARRSTPSTPPSARQPPPPAGSFIHAYNQADDRPPTVINSQPAARTQSSSPTTKQPARSQPLSSDLQPLPQPQPEKPYTPRASSMQNRVRDVAEIRTAGLHDSVLLRATTGGQPPPRRSDRAEVSVCRPVTGNVCGRVIRNSCSPSRSNIA